PAGRCGDAHLRRKAFDHTLGHGSAAEGEDVMTTFARISAEVIEVKEHHATSNALCNLPEPTMDGTPIGQREPWRQLNVMSEKNGPPELQLVLVCTVGHIDAVSHDVDVLEAAVPLQQLVNDDVGVRLLPAPGGEVQCTRCCGTATSS